MVVSGHTLVCPSKTYDQGHFNLPHLHLFLHIHIKTLSIIRHYKFKYFLHIGPSNQAQVFIFLSLYNMYIKTSYVQYCRSVQCGQLLSFYLNNLVSICILRVIYVHIYYSICAHFLTPSTRI